MRNGVCRHCGVAIYWDFEGVYYKDYVWLSYDAHSSACDMRTLRSHEPIPHPPVLVEEP